MKLTKILCLVLLLFGVAFPSFAQEQALPLEKVSLQLDWKFQFEFAGFIAAVEKGFYRAAGLDVTLHEYKAGLDTVEKVLNQQANYGIHNASLVIADGKIQPIVLLATYFQRSPLIFVTSPQIHNPRELTGKTIMGTKDEFKYSTLALMLDHFNINATNSDIVEHSFNIDGFVEGKVDALSAFLSNQIFDLEQKGIKYSIIDPFDYGFYMSAVNLFTSQKEALQHPERTRRFIEASNKGWEYALTHTDEMVALIQRKYAPQRSLEALKYEAGVVERMFLRDFYPIGAVNIELTTRTYKQLLERGMLDQDQKPGPYLFEDFLKAHHLGLEFTREEQKYLQEKKEITYCVDPEWMPFESVEKGKHIGIAADYFSFFQTKLPIPLSLIPTSSWEQSLQFARERKCDVVSLAASTPERLHYMDFTSPYVTWPVVLATRTEEFFIDDIENILHKKIGIVKDYAIAEKLRTLYPDANIVDVKSITDGLERVESGELYGYIDSLMVIADSVQKYFTGVIKVSGRLKEDVKLAVGTRNDEPLLNSVFDKLVLSVPPEKQQGIYNSWVSVKEDRGFDYGLFWKAIIALSFAAGAFAVHNFQLRKYNRLLQDLSITDSLTGLNNRLKLDEELAARERLFQRYDTDCGVILLDIDHFKGINDRHGHLVGDKVLVAFAAILKQNIRATDVLGRWGGEEFLIIAPNTNIVACQHQAEKLLEVIRNANFGTDDTVTASFGVCSFASGRSLKETLARADRALYKAKNSGRNRVESIVSDL
ncbi:diguanylate cyclase [uncultured Desulfuromusa sp.]|uniref:diguanylate cyclase n=1 Tax=uncultured Desulfuromusa sp. TaxID=219183 RepID=UPI002AA6F6D4|nr:diguanylate cyclase [uncultured Desulfuromusa sp.]